MKMAKIYYTSSNFRYTHTKMISGAEISCSLLICEMCVPVCEFACVCRCEFMHVYEGWSLMLDVFLDNSTLFTETRYLSKPRACWLHWSSRMAYPGVPHLFLLSTGFTGRLLIHQAFMWCWVPELWPSCLCGDHFIHWSIWS